MTAMEGLVFIVDDDPSVRKAASRLFRSAGFQVESFHDAHEFLRYERPDLPACAVLDLRMPGLSGMELQRRLTVQDADLPIVFMTGHGDIPKTVEAMKNGAVDFLPKPVDDDLLLETVTQAVQLHAEKKSRSESLAGFRHRIAALTKREREVMQMVMQGLLNKQIAKQLGITEATVKVHRSRVMEKSGVESVAELARLCERAGLTS